MRNKQLRKSEWKKWENRSLTNILQSWLLFSIDDNLEKAKKKNILSLFTGLKNDCSEIRINMNLKYLKNTLSPIISNIVYILHI
jgi:hypothetical protein